MITSTRFLSVATLTMAGVFAIVSASLADGPDPANLVGSKTCGICHKKDETGNQLGKWQASPHAKAFATLGSDKAKEVAKGKGIDNPQTSGKCLKCHATANLMTETSSAGKVKVEEGVSCESCHGPGKKYMAKSTMEDHAKSVAAGMVHPPTQNCKLCHNEESPTFKGFNEQEYVAKIAHPNPAKKK